jgi:hypothetical protein
MPGGVYPQVEPACCLYEPACCLYEPYGAPAELQPAGGSLPAPERSDCDRLSRLRRACSRHAAVDENIRENNRIHTAPNVFPQVSGP